MSDKEGKKLLPIITLSRKQLCKLQRQYKLNKIAKSIDISKLPEREALQVDKYGRVKIDASHPNYKYWTEDDF